MTMATTRETEYPIVIFYSEEDEGYIADIPALKNCSAFGDTPQKALEEVLIAKELWLKTARENNILIPEVDATKVFELSKRVSQVAESEDDDELTPEMEEALDYTLTNHKNVYMALKGR